MHRSCPIGRQHHLNFTFFFFPPPDPSLLVLSFLAPLGFHSCDHSSCSRPFFFTASVSTVVSLTFATPRSVVCCFPLRSFIGSCGKETLPGSYILIRDGLWLFRPISGALVQLLVGRDVYSVYQLCCYLFLNCSCLFFLPAPLTLIIYRIILTFEIIMTGKNSGCGQMIEYIQGTCVICFDPPRLRMTASYIVNLGLITSQRIKIVCTLPPMTPRQTREHRFPSRWSRPSPPASALREPTPAPLAASAAALSILQWRIPCSTMHSMRTLARTTLATSTALRCISTRSSGTPQTVIVR